MIIETFKRYNKIFGISIFLQLFLYLTNKYFDENRFSYEEVYLNYFCSCDYTCKTNGLGISYYPVITRDTLYIHRLTNHDAECVVVTCKTESGQGKFKDFKNFETHSIIMLYHAGILFAK